MAKFLRILALVVLSVFFVHDGTAQAPSVREWPIPASHESGLVTPSFRIKPTFELVNIGESYTELVLKMDVTLATPNNPVAPFSYRYLRHKKEYTDHDIGTAPFVDLKLNNATFSVHVIGPLINTVVNYESNLGRRTIAKVPRNSNPADYTAHIRDLITVSYRGEEPIHRAIAERQAAAAKAQQNEQRLKEEKLAQEKKASEANRLAQEKASQSQGGTTSSTTKSTAGVDDFWADSPASKSTAASTSSSTQQAAPQMTAAQLQSQIQKSFDDEAARKQAVNQVIEQKAQMWQQNYYHAQAVSSGKQNLSEHSQLNGNYNSVEELEAAFNQKMRAINAEVRNLEQARNAQLSNGVAGTFNGNSTDQAIGQGVQAIGNIINSAAAAKEEKEAKEALRAERENQRLRIEKAKKQAFLDMRTSLVTSFPDGGTPLSAHRVSQPQVYMFAYITNRATFENEYSQVSVSNVFAVDQYSDGTFPYKNTVLDKLKGLTQGEITLVGYYVDKAKALEMHSSFLSLAERSNFTVKHFTVKTSTATPASKKSSDDFWETGQKAVPTKKTEKNTNFWVD